MNKDVLLIPAYEPTQVLLDIINELQADFLKIIVVDDGSVSLKSQSIFQTLDSQPSVSLIRHEFNKGKGEALKTGFTFALENFDFSYVVTMDADGQHATEDVQRLSKFANETKDSHLVMGERAFDTKTPIRSRVGNSITVFVFKYLHSFNIKDTQTGLRAIKYEIVSPVLNLDGSGYEYETEMLTWCIKRGANISKMPISTIYINNNESSHFRPFLDSIIIYRTILAYSFGSFLCFVIDYMLFLLLLYTTNSMFGAIVIARVFSGTLNFLYNKILFLGSKNKRRLQALSYLVLALGIIMLSYIITLNLTFFGLPPSIAKPIADFILFFASFHAQKHLFTKIF